MAIEYCSDSDLYSYGLPRGALLNEPARLDASAVDIAADAITLNEHGFDTNDPIQFRAESGGSLPRPLVEGVWYFAIALDGAVFQVAAAADGPAIDLITLGSAVVVVPSLERLKLKARQWASRVIDDSLSGGAVPLTAIPDIVRMTAAELAIGKLLTGSGAASQSLSDMVDAATKRIERWAKGNPVRGENAPKPTQAAQSAVAAVGDPIGWRRFGGLL